MSPRHRTSTLERRDALLRAAIELIAERGVAGVTHREVASRAGVPLGTTSYFFASLDDLVHAALRLVVAEHIAAITEVTARIASGVDDLQTIVDEIVDVLLASPERHVVAQFEIYLDAARRTERRQEVAAVLDAYHALARTALQAAGAEQPDERARLVVALADGLALERLVRGRRPGDRNALHNALLATMTAFLAEGANRAPGSAGRADTSAPSSDRR